MVFVEWKSQEIQIENLAVNALFINWLAIMQECHYVLHQMTYQRDHRLYPPGPKGSFTLMLSSVRNSDLGLYFFAFKCCVSQLSVDRFGNFFEGVMTLGQVKSSQNFCSFGPQRAEKRNI